MDTIFQQLNQNITCLPDHMPLRRINTSVLVKKIVFSDTDRMAPAIKAHISKLNVLADIYLEVSRTCHVLLNIPSVIMFFT